MRTSSPRFTAWCVSALAVALLPACDVEPAEDSTASTEADPSWRAEITNKTRRVQAQDPEFYATIMGLRAQQTRAGFGRILSPHLRDPRATPLLLQRLLLEPSSPSTTDVDTRAALAEAVGRTPGGYARAVAAMLISEGEPRVRTLLVAALKDATGPQAREGLRAGLSDTDAVVRAEAARVLAYRRDDATALLPELLVVLDDADASARASSARTLGIVGLQGATASLTDRLGDADATVRLNALRALGRIDTDSARLLPQLPTLEGDKDRRVAREATRLSPR